MTTGMTTVPLLDLMANRRSRRFALGSHLDGGPLAYRARDPAVPLGEEEEAMLAFAAAGVTGFALADLPYSTGEDPEGGGGNVILSVVGRTVASPDACHTAALFVLNDQGAYLVKRPQDHPRQAIPELAALARNGDFLRLYERSRVRIADSRPDVPRHLPFLPPFNRWSANLPGSTYFLPVSELTALYLAILFVTLGEQLGFYYVDDRNWYRPAGLARFARSRGGHLHDDIPSGRVGTVSWVETYVQELAAVEQGLMLQNLMLATEALGLGGFPHFAAQPYAWFQALGFQMRDMTLSQVTGRRRVMRMLLDRLGKNPSTPVALGLDRDGEPLIKPFCPPHYPSMEAAVRAFVDAKYAAGTGVFRDGSDANAWKDPKAVQAGIPEYSEANIEAVVAYCEYVHGRYGRFPSNPGPFRTLMAYQAHHLETEFYDRFYRTGAYTEAHRRHFEEWH